MSLNNSELDLSTPSNAAVIKAAVRDCSARNSWTYTRANSATVQTSVATSGIGIDDPPYREPSSFDTTEA